MRDNRIDWLRTWRVRAGFEPEQVDRVLKLPIASIRRYEVNGFARGPLCTLYAMAKTYRVGNEELMLAVDEVSSQVRSQGRLQ